MEDSILTSIKKLLGIPSEQTAFDTDIVMHINSALSNINVLGIGPDPQLVISDNTKTWVELGADIPQSVKTYIYLNVLLGFDPPPTSFGIQAVERQIKKLAYEMVLMNEAEV